MTVNRRLSLLVPIVLLGGSLPGFAAGVPPGFRAEVLVDGRAVREYASSGERYIEALKGKAYSIRIHNPLGVRVAVALSVDGLNTIDARHTSARDGRKWVLDPHETVTISGWQVNQEEARRFYFTSEERSYARRLGQPGNIGVISAVFFRERVARVVPLLGLGAEDREPGRREAESRLPAPAESGAASAPAPERRAEKSAAQASADEYAATGIGRRTKHRVQQVYLDLEDRPAAAIDIRYEYRTQLARLGVLPAEPSDDILARRERARGFSGTYCPDVKDDR